VKHYTLLWLVEGEVGARDLVGLMLRGGSSSQTGPSQIMDPTQYQYQHHQHPHEEYQQHYQQEAYQPQYEQPPQQQAEAQGEPCMEFEAGPEGFLGGPSDLSLLPNFGRHVACKLGAIKK